MKKYLFAIVGTVIFSSSALAAGYGDAGCGLGSLVFGKQQGPVQIFAATTNNILPYLQASAISSATSNCDAKGFDTAQLEQERFVTNNFSGLAKEMAAGEGEQLATLAGLLGCPTEKQAHFDTLAQKNYATIFATDATTPAEMLNGVKALMSSDAELSAACIN